MYEIELNGTPVKIWAKGVDPHAMKEIVNLSSLPFVFHHLAFMPDVKGKKGDASGAVVSSLARSCDVLDSFVSEMNPIHRKRNRLL